MAPTTIEGAHAALMQRRRQPLPREAARGDPHAADGPTGVGDTTADVLRGLVGAPRAPCGNEAARCVLQASTLVRPRVASDASSHANLDTFANPWSPAVPPGDVEAALGPAGASVHGDATPLALAVGDIRGDGPPRSAASPTAAVNTATPPPVSAAPRTAAPDGAREWGRSGAAVSEAAGWCVSPRDVEAALDALAGAPAPGGGSPQWPVASPATVVHRPVVGGGAVDGGGGGDDNSWESFLGVCVPQMTAGIPMALDENRGNGNGAVECGESFDAQDAVGTTGSPPLRIDTRAHPWEAAGGGPLRPLSSHSPTPDASFTSGGSDVLYQRVLAALRHEAVDEVESDGDNDEQQAGTVARTGASPNPRASLLRGAEVVPGAVPSGLHAAATAPRGGDRARCAGEGDDPYAVDEVNITATTADDLWEADAAAEAAGRSESPLESIETLPTNLSAVDGNNRSLCDATHDSFAAALRPGGARGRGEAASCFDGDRGHGHERAHHHPHAGRGGDGAVAHDGRRRGAADADVDVDVDIGNTTATTADDLWAAEGAASANMDGSARDVDDDGNVPADHAVGWVHHGWTDGGLGSGNTSDSVAAASDSLSRGPAAGRVDANADADVGFVNEELYQTLVQPSLDDLAVGVRQGRGVRDGDDGCVREASGAGAVDASYDPAGERQQQQQQRQPSPDPLAAAHHRLLSFLSNSTLADLSDVSAAPTAAPPPQEASLHLLSDISSIGGGGGDGGEEPEHGNHGVAPVAFGRPPRHPASATATAVGMLDGWVEEGGYAGAARLGGGYDMPTTSAAGTPQGGGGGNGMVLAPSASMQMEDTLRSVSPILEDKECDEDGHGGGHGGDEGNGANDGLAPTRVQVHAAAAAAPGPACKPAAVGSGLRSKRRRLSVAGAMSVDAAGLLVAEDRAAAAAVAMTPAREGGVARAVPATAAAPPDADAMLRSISPIEADAAVLLEDCVQRQPVALRNGGGVPSSAAAPPGCARDVDGDADSLLVEADGLSWLSSDARDDAAGRGPAAAPADSSHDNNTLTRVYLQHALHARPILAHAQRTAVLEAAVASERALLVAAEFRSAVQRRRVGAVFHHWRRCYSKRCTVKLVRRTREVLAEVGGTASRPSTHCDRPPSPSSPDVWGGYAAAVAPSAAVSTAGAVDSVAAAATPRTARDPHQAPRGDPAQVASPRACPDDSLTRWFRIWCSRWRARGAARRRQRDGSPLPSPHAVVQHHGESTHGGLKGSGNVTSTPIAAAAAAAAAADDLASSPIPTAPATTGLAYTPTPGNGARSTSASTSTPVSALGVMRAAGADADGPSRAPPGASPSPYLMDLRARATPGGGGSASPDGMRSQRPEEGRQRGRGAREASEERRPSPSAPRGRGAGASKHPPASPYLRVINGGAGAARLASSPPPPRVRECEGGVHVASDVDAPPTTQAAGSPYLRTLGGAGASGGSGASAVESGTTPKPAPARAEGVGGTGAAGVAAAASSASAAVPGTSPRPVRVLTYRGASPSPSPSPSQRHLADTRTAMPPTSERVAGTAGGEALAGARHGDRTAQHHPDRIEAAVTQPSTAYLQRVGGGGHGRGRSGDGGDDAVESPPGHPRVKCGVRGGAEPALPAPAPASTSQLPWRDCDGESTSTPASAPPRGDAAAATPRRARVRNMVRDAPVAHDGTPVSAHPAAPLTAHGPTTTPPAAPQSRGGVGGWRALAEARGGCGAPSAGRTPIRDPPWGGGTCSPASPVSGEADATPVTGRAGRDRWRVAARTPAPWRIDPHVRGFVKAKILERSGRYAATGAGADAGDAAVGVRAKGDDTRRAVRGGCVDDARPGAAGTGTVPPAAAERGRQEWVGGGGHAAGTYTDNDNDDDRVMDLAQTPAVEGSFRKSARGGRAVGAAERGADSPSALICFEVEADAGGDVEPAGPWATPPVVAARMGTAGSAGRPAVETCRTPPATRAHDVSGMCGGRGVGAPTPPAERTPMPRRASPPEPVQRGAAAARWAHT